MELIKIMVDYLILNIWSKNKLNIKIDQLFAFDLLIYKILLRLSSGKTRFNCLGLCDLINVGKNIALCLELLWVLCIILTTILGSAVKILRQQENPLIIICSFRFFSLNKKVRAIKYSFNFS